jgi:hypothetical protein
LLAGYFETQVSEQDEHLRHVWSGHDGHKVALKNYVLFWLRFQRGFQLGRCFSWNWSDGSRKGSDANLEKTSLL